MVRISALNAKTLTDTRHIVVRQKSKNAVACLMCLARISKRKKITKNQRKEQDARIKPRFPFGRFYDCTLFI